MLELPRLGRIESIFALKRSSKLFFFCFIHLKFVESVGNSFLFIQCTYEENLRKLKFSPNLLLYLLKQEQDGKIRGS